MLAYAAPARPAAPSLASQPAIPLPVRTMPTPADEPPPQTGPDSPARFPVYLVEPDRTLRIALARDLTAAGFGTRPFSDVGDLAAAVAELAPGCVILDVAAIAEAAPSLSAGDGIGALHFPAIAIYATLAPEEAVAAIRCGAVDLLPRPVAVADLVAALHRAAPKVRTAALQLAARRARAAIGRLTPREREVMDCISDGFSNKAIARLLGLSPRTVEMHRARLHRRLGVGSLAELLALAWNARGA